MSLEYCEECDKMIDLDVDEHFEHFKVKEFNLSEKIEKIKWKDGVVLKLGLKTEDVKEFIRLLKEEICNPDAFISMDEKIIDKLAGDDLK